MTASGKEINIDGLLLYVDYQSLEGDTVTVNYTPLDGGKRLRAHAGSYDLVDNGAADAPKLKRIWDLVATNPPRDDLLVEGERLSVEGRLRGLAIAEELDQSVPQIRIPNATMTTMHPIWSFAGATAGESRPFRIDPLEAFLGQGPVTPGLQGLVESVMTTARVRAWRHLRSGLGMSIPLEKLRVFISYRRGREAFAEAVARRLGREGFLPFLDVWDVVAGDSLPGRLGQELDRSVAFVPIVTADYAEGWWSRDEYENALVRANTPDGLRIVPILLEAVQPPGLLASKTYVDFSDQDHQQFEKRMGRVVDGINRLSRNPFGG